MRLRTDDRAVAPVVGIALLIAISVILAGVIGSVIFGLSTDPGDSPQVTLSFAVESGTVTLNHEGGETLDTDEVVIKDRDGVVEDLSGVDEINAGESIDTGVDADAHDRVSVVWRDPASDAESVLATFEP